MKKTTCALAGGDQALLPSTVDISLDGPIKVQDTRWASCRGGRRDHGGGCGRPGSAIAWRDSLRQGSL